MFYLVSKGICQSPDSGFAICLGLAFFFFFLKGILMDTSSVVPCHRIDVLDFG